MVKVCHFSSAHRGLDIRIFRKECATLAKSGFETYLVINATESDVFEAFNSGVKLIPLEYVPESRRFKRMFLHAFNCYRQALKINADIYHFHDPELIPYGLLLAWKGKKVIYDAHEDLPGSIMSKHWISKPLRSFVAAISGMVERFGARRFAAVVTATPFIGGLFSGAAKRVEIINNFPILGELLTLTSGDSVRTKIAYVGGIEVIRGIREVVDALNYCDADLQLAGPISGTLKAELTLNKGWIRVKELGVIGRSQVAAILEDSFAGIVTFLPEPNHINAQPNKMFEYMSAGVPVIASNFPLWKQVIEGNECGICVDPKNSQEIATAMNYLKDRPDEVKRFGENGRLAVFQKYNWDCESGKLIALYQELASNLQD